MTRGRRFGIPPVRRRAGGFRAPLQRARDLATGIRRVGARPVAGRPVELRGIRIGEVLDVQLQLDAENAPPTSR